MWAPARACGATVATPSVAATCSATVGEKPPSPPKPDDSACTTKSPLKPRLTYLSIEALADAPNTDSRPTRATPMISAEAVADVRFGLREAFSTARRPVMPDTW